MEIIKVSIQVENVRQYVWKNVRGRYKGEWLEPFYEQVWEETTHTTFTEDAEGSYFYFLEEGESKLPAHFSDNLRLVGDESRLSDPQLERYVWPIELLEVVLQKKEENKQKALAWKAKEQKEWEEHLSFLDSVKERIKETGVALSLEPSVKVRNLLFGEKEGVIGFSWGQRPNGGNNEPNHLEVVVPFLTLKEGDLTPFLLQLEEKYQMALVALEASVKGQAKWEAEYEHFKQEVLPKGEGFKVEVLHNGKIYLTVELGRRVPLFKAPSPVELKDAPKAIEELRARVAAYLNPPPPSPVELLANGKPAPRKRR